jgi:uncharacterized delta-60 repeat protein
LAALLIPLVRPALAAQGDLDQTFGAGGTVTTLFGPNDYATALVLQPDGKIVAAGRSAPSGSAYDFALVRYGPQGEVDTSFGTAGKVITDFGGEDFANALVLQPDGKLVAAGYKKASTDWWLAMARYLGEPPPTATPTPTPTPTPTATAPRLLLPLSVRPPPLGGGDFEDGPAGWTLEDAPLPARLTDEQSRSPARSLRLGDPGWSAPERCLGHLPLGRARASRQVLVPDRAGVNLSFWYRVFSQDKTVVNQGAVDTLDVWVDGALVFRGGYDGTELAGCGAARDQGWKPGGADLRAYRGKTVTLAFELWSREPDGRSEGYYNTYAYLDDVRIDPP